MTKALNVNGITSVIIRVKILDTSKTDGSGLAGLTNASSGLVISTIANNEATPTVYTVAAGDIETITTLGTYAAPTASKCRFKEVHATNHKGTYEIHLADARWSVADAKSLQITVYGAANALQVDAEYQLTSFDMDKAITSTAGKVTVGTNDDKAGYSISGTKTTLDALNDLTAVQVNAEVDAALDTAIPGTPTANSINERLKSLDDAYTATRAGYLDKLNISGNVASQTEVLAIQNNTRTTVSVTPVMERPDSGSTRYKIHLNNYDTAGNMEAPDSAPTVAVANEEGVDRSGNLQHPTTHAAQTTTVLLSTGRYWIEYDLDNTDAIEGLVFTITVIEGGVTRTFDRVAQVVDTTAVDFTAADRTKLESINSKLPTGNIADASVCTETRLAELDAENMPADLAVCIAGLVAINSDTDDIQSRIPASLVSGKIDASVGDIVASAIAKLFTLASGETYSTSITQSLVKEIADNAGGGGGETQLYTGTAIAGSISTITFPVGAPADDNILVNQRCVIISGAGSPACEFIGGYDATTRVATFATNLKVAVDNTSVFVVLPMGTIPGATAPTAAAIADAVYDEATADHNTAGTYGEKINKGTTVILGPVQAATLPGNRLSSPMPLEMFQHETKIFPLTVKDSAGNVVDLSAMTLRFVVHDENDPTSSVFKVEDNDIAKSGASNEIASVTVSASLASLSNSSLRWKLFDLTGDLVLMHGSFKIEPSKKDSP